MSYKKLETGPLITDEEGKLDYVTNEFKGKIIKVRVIYNKPLATTETCVKIETMEEELIWDLVNNNEDVVVYPRILLMQQKKFMHVAWQEGQEMAEQVVNVGPVKIEVKGAKGKGPAIKNVVFTYEE